VSRIVELSDEPVVGASAPTFSWSYCPKPVVLKAGDSWSGTVKETVEVTLSDENSTVERSKTRWNATYRALDPKVETFSGCDYDTMPIEAEVAGERGTVSLRWVYVTRLGFGLETRRDGKANGLVAMAPV
jgi:hypothetical protein